MVETEAMAETEAMVEMVIHLALEEVADARQRIAGPPTAWEGTACRASGAVVEAR